MFWASAATLTPWQCCCCCCAIGSCLTCPLPSASLLRWPANSRSSFFSSSLKLWQYLKRENIQRRFQFQFIWCNKHSKDIFDKKSWLNILVALYLHFFFLTFLLTKLCGIFEQWPLWRNSHFFAIYLKPCQYLVSLSCGGSWWRSCLILCFSPTELT